MSVAALSAAGALALFFFAFVMGVLFGACVTLACVEYTALRKRRRGAG